MTTFARRLTCLIVACAGFCTLPAPGSAQPPTLTLGAPELPVREVRLENGMHFLLLPRAGAPTVAFVAHVPVGSVNEALGSTGIAHFLEHLLFKGSTTIGTSNVDAEREVFRTMDAAHDSLIRARGRLPFPDSSEIPRFTERIRILEDSARQWVIPNEYDAILSRNGARGLNATTSWEATEYYVELPSNRIELWFALESDRMRNPVFREFYTERDVVAEERRARVESSPGGLLYESFLGAAFRAHPYGVLPIGHMDDITALSRREVDSWYRRYYGPNNVTVAMVGDFDPDSAAAMAERYFGSIPAGETPPPLLIREPEQRGERRVELVHDAEPELLIGWKVPSGYHDDAFTLAMLANILVGGRDSRLFRRLVRDDRIAASVTAGTTPSGRYPGLFTIQAVPLAPHSVEAVETVIHEELARLLADPPTPLEIERVRVGLEAARVRRLTSSLGLAFQLVESHSFWGDWQTTFLTQERMQRVDSNALVEAVRRYFVEENRTVAILRREGS